METGGRLHPDFLLWLKSYLRASCGDDHLKFYWAYKNTVQRISVALRGSLGRAFLSLDSKALHYPTVPPHNGVVYG